MQRRSGRRQPDFPSIQANEFPALVDEYRRRASRQVTEVHLHHTFIPDQALFEEQTRLLGSAQAAGQELMRRMWRFHTQDNGWSDIAQHVSVMPDGSIWIGRNFDSPPASARGFNGSTARGPFMIETVGNFDTEVPTDEQIQAIVTIIASVQLAFGLGADALAFHNEMTDSKSCPGAFFEHRLPKKDLINLIKAEREKLKEKPMENGRKRGRRALPLDRSEQTIVQAVDWMARRAAATGGDDAREVAAEPDEGDAAMRAFAERAVAERGDTGLSTEVLNRLKPHVINLNQGTYSDDGDFQTSKEDVEDLVGDHLAAWVSRQKADGHRPRLVVYAHGGLVSEESALAQVAGQFQWWLDNGVYPVFFVWETGLMETVMQLIGRLLPGERILGLGTLRDAAVEAVVHSVGRPFWKTMKVSAERASDSHERFGAYYFATLLADFLRNQAPELEVNVVGHSAGGIFHAYFLRELKERNIPVNTAQFLAPACTTELARQLIVPNIDGQSIGHFSLFAMNDKTERADPTVPGYGKSLLYLVSRGFESDFGAPLLGLQKSVKKDSEIKQALGLGSGGGQHGNVVWSPTGENVAPILRSNSTTHGGFDNDADTMTAVMMRITGRSSPADLVPFPEELRERALAPLFRPLRLPPEVEDLLRLTERPAAPAVPTGDKPVVTMPAPAGPVATAPSGNRHALCIGIDDYATAPLYGCVNDARLWRETFTGLGFSTDLLLNREATFDGLMQALQALVARAGSGDMIVLQYAGHGTRVPDVDGDEAEQDDLDEALVPVDYDSSGGFLIDDDIRQVLAALAPGAHMTAFFDCCHSGSISRLAVGRSADSGAVRQRYLRLTPQLRSAHIRFRQDRGIARVTRSESDQDAMRHIQFSACQDYQTAKESEGHGWFTLAATSVIGSRPGAVSNSEIADRIEQEFRDRNRRDQDPRLEGPTALRRSLFLAGIAG